MRKVVITEEEIRHWAILHRESDWTPRKPYCKLCSNIVKVHRRVSRRRSQINYFRAGEEVYRVDYPNGTYGLYHIECIEDPKNADKLKNVLRMDVDRWDGLKDFLNELSKEDLTERQLIDRVKARFKCGHTTAWRRVKAFMQNPT
jgi:hypothetical protein